MEYLHRYDIPIYCRSWAGDYLNNTSQNVDVHSYRDALRKEGVSGVAFSCKTQKFNRHGKVVSFTMT